MVYMSSLGKISSEKYTNNKTAELSSSYLKEKSFNATILIEKKFLVGYILRSWIKNLCSASQEKNFFDVILVLTLRKEEYYIKSIKQLKFSKNNIILDKTKS